MAIIKWHPFSEIDEFFEDVMHHKNGWDLAVDVCDDENNVYVEMQIPGIDPDKVEIALDDNHLHVSGSREEESETKDKNYYRKEIKRGSFERIVPLPVSVSVDDAQAEFSNGVLKITLPKQRGKQKHKVIKVTKK